MRSAISANLTPVLAVCLTGSLCTQSAPVYLDEFEDGGRLATPPAEVVYRNATGQNLRLLLCAPAGAQPGDARAAVVWIHGGGWSSGTPEMFLPQARYAAARGAVGISLGYRLIAKTDASGARPGVTLADAIADCQTAIRHLRGHAAAFGLDPKRIAVAGDSAGGHLAACLGTLPPLPGTGEDPSVSPWANAVIACNPITDLTGSWHRVVPETPLPDDPPAAADAVGRWYQARERARRLSPLFQVTPGLPPFLVMHGLADTVVQPEDSVRFVEALRAADNRAELALFPDARHAFVVTGYSATDDEIVRALQTSDRFLASLGYLQGGPTLALRPPPRPRLVAHYTAARFPTGTAADAVDAPPPLTAVNVAPALAPTDPQDQGFDFAGKGSRLTATGVPDLGPAGTYTLRVKPSVAGGTLIRREHKFGFDLKLLADGALHLHALRFDLHTSPGAVPLQAWTEVAVTIGPEELTLYLNGQTAATTANPARQSLKGNVLVFGEGVSGRLDAFRVYNYPLTAGEIARRSPAH